MSGTFINIYVWEGPEIRLTKAGLQIKEAVRYYYFIENFTINVLNPSQVYNICPTREIAERSSELPENLQYAKPSRRSVRWMEAHQTTDTSSAASPDDTNRFLQAWVCGPLPGKQRPGC